MWNPVANGIHEKHGFDSIKKKMYLIFYLISRFNDIPALKYLLL